MVGHELTLRYQVLVRQMAVHQSERPFQRAEQAFGVQSDVSISPKAANDRLLPTYK